MLREIPRVEQLLSLELSYCKPNKSLKRKFNLSFRQSLTEKCICGQQVDVGIMWFVRNNDRQVVNIYNADGLFQECVTGFSYFAKF
jgi:hypothetical protein